MGKYGAIDIMNYTLQCVPETGARLYREYADWKFVERAYGMTWPWPGTHNTVEEMIAEMDEVGFDKIVMSAPKMWLQDKILGQIGSIEIIRDVVQRSNGRVIGAATYNPFDIQGSLKEIDVAVKEWGFRMVFHHGETFDLALNDKRFYPCYTKCYELGIPVSMQTGHSGELLPSWGGRPIYLDSVAIDFPDLKIILSHTGWPWVEEWIAMVMKHPNVYGDISGWPPKLLSRKMPAIVEFLKTRVGQNKVLFGTNAQGLRKCLNQFMELPFSDEVKKAVLRDNAVKVLGL